MAKASKRRPWVVEMQPPLIAGWYQLDAFGTADEARHYVERARERARIDATSAAFRFRNIWDEAAK